MFLTSLKQTCSEYLIKFSENQCAPKLENRKTSPFAPCAPNLPHVLLSRIPGYHNLCSPDRDDNDVDEFRWTKFSGVGWYFNKFYPHTGLVEAAQFTVKTYNPNTSHETERT